MKPYRVKHVPTGLYYKPDEPQLSEEGGKIYTTSNSIIQYAKAFGTTIRIPNNSRLIKKYPIIKSLSIVVGSGDYLIKIDEHNINDFQIEEL